MGTVLVVEDEQGLRDVIEIALSASHYTVLLAEDGDQAVHVCGEHQEPIDIVLTDVCLPDVTAFELIPRILEICPQTKVLVMSGYDKSLAQSLAPEYQYAWIAKPFELADLVHRVEEIYRHAQRGPQLH